MFVPLFCFVFVFIVTVTVLNRQLRHLLCPAMYVQYFFCSGLSDLISQGKAKAIVLLCGVLLLHNYCK